ncbi:hypothetical protein RND71_008528 [Anisodus tanguticus]|uniref:Uncharacterized protein n=1 Tax=Anisodus tanguticus TaxID=243964 RepID=A0AAE1SNV3_9SOLA|nr:hypothetical protein RND71_008528 [Anisodus tanguticus]
MALYPNNQETYQSKQIYTPRSWLKGLAHNSFNYSQAFNSEKTKEIHMDRTKKTPCRYFEGKAPIEKLTINESRKSIPITEGVKEPHKCRPGIVTLLEIHKPLTQSNLTKMISVRRKYHVTKKISCRSFRGKTPTKKLTIKEACKSVSITDGVKQPHKYRPKIFALLKICKYQKSTQVLIRKLPLQVLFV